MGECYLFGAVYIIEQDYSDEEILKDLKNMKANGFNLITLWPVSNPWLSKNSKEYIFTKTRYVMNICQELEMKVILQLFGQNPAYEFMSDSDLTRDMMIEDEEGLHINYNCFWMNLNHTKVRNLLVEYFKVAINEFKDHPALYGWDVFNEAHFRSDDEYTIKLYQKWLENRYKDINILNRHWYRRYLSFEEVIPLKRRSAYSIWSSILPDAEYEIFRSENLTEICSFLYKTAKTFDSEHPIIIDGTSSQLLYNKVNDRNNNEFDTAMIPDVYGATFYPKSWGRNYRSKPWMAAMYYTMPASAAIKAKKPYFVNELQTHTQSLLTPGSEVTPQELCNWTWMCIFTGASAMQLWRWRPFLHGYQSTGRGLTRIDGIPNKRGEIIEELVKNLESNKDIFTNFIASKYVVKIAVSYRSRIFFDAFSKWNSNIWPDEVAGWYRAIWEMGLPVGFTDIEKFDEEDLSTPIIILPSIITLSSKDELWLERYVREGGILLADARLNAVNEYGVVPSEGIPGAQLTKLFGVRELDVDSESFFVLNEEKINANFMHQILEVHEDTTVVSIMEDGSPSIVKKKYGKGTTLYFNSFVGAEMAKAVPLSITKLLKDIFIEVLPDLCYVEKSDKVHVAFIDSDNKKVMLAINFSDHEQKMEISNLKAISEIRNLITGEIYDIKSEVEIKLRADSHSLFMWEM